MYQAAFDPSPPSPKKDNKAANGTNGKENLRVEDLKKFARNVPNQIPRFPVALAPGHRH